MPTFKEFQDLISNEINQYCFIEVGHIGSGYLCVLIIRNDKIEVVGELLYSCWREGMEDYSILSEFGKEVQKYIDGKREDIPRLCYSPNRKLEVS